MGRVKEVLAELDNGVEVVITLHGVSIASTDTAGVGLWITTNDLEQCMQVIRYLREIRPFESLAEITGEHKLIDWEGPKTVPETTVMAAGRKGK
jgi:hypothetical protein